ncbi:hypothetical protein [Faecalibacter rhinopitheci]|uniref:Uncharacterized protein n=1 Tax=Faecalibacter rhinopitheci TaxID=2779678 RepID=A0A8J7KCP7_9FLAO|nr:hypothetical protein [Faecalibacter rhinopitheci]MBF0596491.1 hypothetical protein [Faecalibacter rhinopitheci]
MITKILIVVTILIGNFSLAQRVSTANFGPVNYKMTDQQIYSLNPDKLAVFDVNNPDMPEQDININGVNYHVVYYKNLYSKKNEFFSVESEGKELITLSGIKIGSSLDDLWKVYKNNSISYLGTDDNRYFTFYDLENETELIFYLKNNKVWKIKLSYEKGYLNNNIYYQN